MLLLHVVLVLGAGRLQGQVVLPGSELAVDVALDHLDLLQVLRTGGKHLSDIFLLEVVGFAQSRTLLLQVGTCLAQCLVGIAQPQLFVLEAL